MTVHPREVWLLCRDEIDELIRLDELRGGPNVRQWNARLEELKTAPTDVLTIALASLITQRKGLQRTLQRHMEDTGNWFGVPDRKPVKYEQPVSSDLREARRRAAAELREMGEIEAADLLRSGT